MSLRIRDYFTIVTIDREFYILIPHNIESTSCDNSLVFMNFHRNGLAKVTVKILRWEIRSYRKNPMSRNVAKKFLFTVMTRREIIRCGKKFMSSGRNAYMSGHVGDALPGITREAFFIGKFFV